MQPNAERLAVQWAKANAALTAVVAGRVATKLPSDWGGDNFIRVVVVDVLPGVAESGDLGLPILQWDVYGKGEQGGNPPFGATHDLAAILLYEAERAVDWRHAELGAIGSFAYVNGPRQVEPDAPVWARWQLDMTCAVKP